MQNLSQTIKAVRKSLKRSGVTLPVAAHTSIPHLDLTAATHSPKHTSVDLKHKCTFSHGTGKLGGGGRKEGV